jgi:hypothetical protein
VVPERFLDSDKALACIHCGLAELCPTYLETGKRTIPAGPHLPDARSSEDGCRWETLLCATLILSGLPRL